MTIALIRYERKSSDTDANNALVLGIGASTNSLLTLRNGNGATLNGALTITNGALTTGAITSTSLTINGGGGTVFTVNGGNAVVNGNILSVSQNVAGDMTAGRVITNLGNNNVRKIVTYQNFSDFEFNGIGTLNDSQIYNVGNTGWSHVFYAANTPSSLLELFRIAGNGNAVLAGALQAVPQYATRSKLSPQNIAANSSGTVSWTDDLAAGPLTSNGVRWTNSTGRTLVIMVNYCIRFNSTAFGGVISSYIFISNAPNKWWSTTSTQNSIGVCTSSGIIVMAPGSYIECNVDNPRIEDAIISTQGTNMTYYLLN